MKKTYISFALIALLTLIYYFIQAKGPEKLSKSPPTQQVTQAPISTKQFMTSDKRIAISYPATWYATDSTPASGNGQFGPYVQAWTVQSFQNQQVGQVAEIPENSAKIDFEIMQGGQNLPLESLIDCGMKTVACERIGINNELFIKASSVLNTGMKVIQIATFYDNNVFRATAYIQTGDKQDENATEVEEIFNSVTFSQTNPQ